MFSLRIATRLLSFLVLILISIGALVTSHDAGLSVPDWPTSYGYNMFTFPVSMWIGGILYEHGHRLLASFVGLVTLVIAVAIALKESRTYVKVTAWVALGIVIFQGLLGGLTVILQLPDAVSVTHAILGQTFFLVTITLAFFYSQERAVDQFFVLEVKENPIALAALWSIGALYVQLLLGALMRHSGSALAIPDFPTTGGQFIPRFDASMMNSINQWRTEHQMLPATLSQVIKHLLHRIGAIVVLIAEWGLISRVMVRERSNACFLAGLLIAQILLGVATIFSVREPWIASLHVAVGALFLGATYLIGLNAATSSRKLDN